MTWMQTFTGRKFDYANPRAEDVDILDIATALSRIPRFFGHTKVFYSVAQHSVLVSQHVNRPDLRLPGLLHDAHEAYLGDMIQPLKEYLRSVGAAPELNALRHRIDDAIARRFNFPSKLFQEGIKAVDLQALSTEKNALMGPSPEPWATLPNPFPFPMLVAWDPDEAKRRFMERFQEICRITGYQVSFHTKSGSLSNSIFATLDQARDYADHAESVGMTDITLENVYESDIEQPAA